MAVSVISVATALATTGYRRGRHAGYGFYRGSASAVGLGVGLLVGVFNGLFRILGSASTRLSSRSAA